jgi:hypothetical protein
MLKELPVNRKRRVTQSFEAKLATSRGRERFGAGELLMLTEVPEPAPNSRFVRVNGLRPSRGVECQYIIESAELDEKTELAR